MDCRGDDFMINPYRAKFQFFKKGMDGYTIFHVPSQKYLKLEQNHGGKSSQEYVIKCKFGEQDATVFVVDGVTYDKTLQVRPEPTLLRTKGGTGFERTIEGDLFAFQHAKSYKWLAFTKGKAFLK